ncbi:trehalase, partial [Helicosporidium sp. ATCC 50920]
MSESAPAWDAESKKGVTGPLLLNSFVATVDDLAIYNDSKVIVDMPLRRSPSYTYKAFKGLTLPERVLDAARRGVVIRANRDVASSNETDAERLRRVLTDFVNEHQLPLGSDMEAATTPELWHAAQPLLPWARTLSDPSLRDFASALWKIWPTLLRQARPEVRVSPQRFTLLPVPFPFMVPGVRFREGYYWDSYFVIQGLLAGGATATAQNQVLNMADLIQRYGHMPNGLRTYYLNRSQPPIFCLSVRAVFTALGGKFENPKDAGGVVEAFAG